MDGCEMHGSLDGDTACPPIKYYIKQGEGGEVEIHYNREPCEVSGLVWQPGDILIYLERGVGGE